jgi:hypothetical protein
VDVRVKTPYGTSLISTGDQFTYGAQPIAGDANSDGMVNVTDFQILYRNLGQAGDWSAGDFDGDGLVDFGDFQILELNFGKSTPQAAAPVWTNWQVAVAPEAVVRGVIIARRGRFSGCGISISHNSHDAATTSR